jgi:hypothetical protein
MSERNLYVEVRPLYESPEEARFGVFVSEEGLPRGVPSFYGMEPKSIANTPGFSHSFDWNPETVNRRLPGLIRGVVGGFLEQMAQGLRRLLAREPLAGERREIGMILYEAIFREKAREKLEKAITDARAKEGEIKLRLVLGSPSLNVIPWECLYYPPDNRYLVLLPEVSFSRFQPVDVAWRRLTLNPPLRVLLVDGRPRTPERLFGLPPLMDKLSQAEDKLEVDVIRPSGQNDLEEHLIGGDIHVVHFFAHMELQTNVAYLVLPEEGAGRIHDRAYRIRDLGYLFLGSDVRLLILTPCLPPDNMWLGNLIGARVEELGIPAVLTTQMGLSDSQTADFAENLYVALAEGQAVDRAVADAQRQLARSPRDPIGAFALFLSTPDGELFDLKTADEVHEADVAATRDSIISVIQQVGSVTSGSQVTGVSIDELWDSDAFDTYLEESALDEDAS